MNQSIKYKYIVVLILFYLTPIFGIFAQNINDSLIIKGIYQYNTNSLDSAKINFNTALKNSPNDAAYYYLAKIAMLQNDLTTSELLIKKL